MPVLISFFVPFITAGVLLYFFKKNVTTWEWLALVGSSIVFTIIVYFASKAISQQDTEYLGGYVTEIKHYDDWNERVRKTREVPCGTDKDGHTKYCTETYYVTEYHPEYWVMITTLDKFEQRIKKETFERFKKRLNSPEIFIDMHRHYYTNDGDAQSHKWLGTRNTIIPVTEEHSYHNPMKNSNSIFRYSEIDKDSAKVLGLYDYPKFSLYNQNPIIGCKATDRSKEQLNYVNAMFGAKYQFRCYILVYPAEKGLVISEMQKGYWQGGNKNELIVCLGVNKNSEVEWCNAFSWCDEPWLEVETRSWFSKHTKLNLYEYGVWLERNVPTKWKRKEFKDFDYIQSSLPAGAKWVIFVLTMVFCIGFSVFVVENWEDR